MIGAARIEESGLVDGRVMITNTHTVDVDVDALVDWRLRHDPVEPCGDSGLLPVPAETGEAAATT